MFLEGSPYGADENADALGLSMYRQN